MLNELVLHNRFGKGKVIEQTGNHIRIEFFEPEETKIFQYPDSFENFLRFENDQLQSGVINDLSIIRDLKQAEENKKILEYQKQEDERKKTKKVVVKKQQKK
jgi:hypothetical protein